MPIYPQRAGIERGGACRVTRNDCLEAVQGMTYKSGIDVGGTFTDFFLDLDRGGTAKLRRVD